MILDVAVDFVLADLVRARPERRIEARFIKRVRRVISLGEDRQARDIEWHVAGVLFRERDHHGRIVNRFGLHQVAQLNHDQRVALFFQRGQREGDVMRRQFRAIVESRFGSHRKAVGELVGGNPHGFRRKAVHRVGFVVRASHQAHERHVHALRAFALQDVGVERIEGEEGLVVGANRWDQRKQSALRRGHIDVFEMMKIGRIFQIAEHRHSVGLGAAFLGRRRGRPEPSCAQRADAENEHMAAGERGCAKRTVQERPPVLAAFSASHHHRVGNPEVPYLGNGSGWLKRSQRAAR